MVKVTGPLFGASAQGQIGGIGTFRMRKGQAEFIKIATVNDRQSDKQLQLRGCFAAAKKAHAEIPKSSRGPWVLFWRQWLVDHPECLL